MPVSTVISGEKERPAAAKCLTGGWKPSLAAPARKLASGSKSGSSPLEKRDRARWHYHCEGISSMQISRFVVSYKDVQPGEHVLYSVLEDRYVGVDDPTLQAVSRWEKGAPPANANERETQDV